EAAKFVGDFKSLANEADASLAKHKALELEIERLLKAVVSQDIMNIMQKESVVDKSDLQTELEHTRNPLSQKLENENVELEFQVSDQKDNTYDTSANTKFAKQPIVENLPKVGETHALSNPITSNSIFTPQEPKVVKNDKWGNILITRVYFVEGLGHNLFLVRQFCDSDLEVAFRRNASFVRNLEGVGLLKGDHSTNLYTINLHEMASASPICLMAHASSTKSWLWHQRLSHLNFDTINDLVSGLPKFKYNKEHLCPSCEQGKSKKASRPPKPVLNSRQRLHLLHMDLCGSMRIASINGKRISQVTYRRAV
nr:retrovirus-related Pol polyprotein from transposon TNT 1-94 [Tanacetum cinerariifolium]